MLSSPPPAAPLPDPFAYRQTARYKSNNLKRLSGFLSAKHNQHWNFDMNPNQSGNAAAPATAQEQIRLNVQREVTAIFEAVQGASERPQLVPRYTKRVLDHIEGTAGPFDAITNNERMWETMVIAAVHTAGANVLTDNNTNPLEGLTQTVRECVQEFEMNNLGLDQEGYQNYLITQAKMRSHPGFVHGATVAVHASPVRASVREAQGNDPRANQHVSSPQPVDQSHQNTMNTNTNTQATSNGPSISVTPGTEGTTHIHVSGGQPTNTDTIGNAPAPAPAEKVRKTISIEMLPSPGKFKKALKIVGGAVVVAGLGYAGYRAYKAGMFGIAKNVVVEGLPNAAEAIANSAQATEGMGIAVASFFNN